VTTRCPVFDDQVTERKFSAVLHQLHIYAAFGESKLYVTPAG
jgi:hypothetical protein